MNTKILEYIIAIAQERSISKAAERFYLTQPVLSRHLKKIEEQIGAPLFLRQKDGMTLTEAGRIYINSAQNVLHLESELEADLRTMLAEKKNTLRVFVDFPYISQLSDRVLPGFQQKYPDVQVRFLYGSTDEILATLAVGESGLGMLILPDRRLPALEYVTLRTDALTVVRPVGGQNTDTVFIPPSGTSLRAEVDRWLVQQGAGFSAVLEVQAFRAGLEGALSGQGCACVPLSAAAHKGLETLPGVAPLPFQVCVAYSPNMVFRPADRALLQELLRLAAEWPYPAL